jgi:hypothetical protein
MKKGGNTKHQTRRLVWAFSALLVFVAGVFLISTAIVVRAVSFEDVSQTLGLGTSDLKETVINIINWALGLLGLVGVVFMLYGGYLWLTSGGNEDRIRRAKRILINTVIGLVIILLAWAIVAFVLKFGEDVTGSGETCTEGEEMGCWDCVGGSWVYDPTNPGCTTLPTTPTFEIRNIVTSCVAPPDYRNDVYRCSGVTVVFNNVLDLTTVDQNTMNDGLLVEQCNANPATGAPSDFDNCWAPTQPTPVFNDPAVLPNEIVYSGALPTGTRAEIVANRKTFSFVHAQAEFEANTFYQIRIPKAASGIKDVAGHELTACKDASGAPIVGCVESATYFSWIFRVGIESDEIAPTLVSSYPRYTTDPSYPDRNVSRTPIITARFSEAMAPWTLIEDNIKIYGFDPADPPTEAGGFEDGTRLAAPIDPANYDVFEGSGDDFLLQFTAGFSLDAFSWYEIELNNLADLCSNILTPAPTTWRFETNGLGAGIATVYPPDGFEYACPSTEVFVRFNTTMYDPATSGCTVLPPVGFVTNGTLNPPPPRLFEVEDDYPGVGDPNAYCKKYSWRPVANPLFVSTNYTASVDTRYQINEAGEMLEADWSFKTAMPETCANPPVIDLLSPDNGPAGTCLSVIGNHFDPDGDNQGEADGDDLTFSGSSALSDVKRWAQRAIVVNAPTGPSGASPVQVSVHYDPPIGTLQSNTVDFNYLPGSPGSGPCLIELNPESGLRTQGYQLIGELFNPSSSTKLIHFGVDTSPGSWTSDFVANSTVPATAPAAPPPAGAVSLVSLENDVGRSNELPFSVFSVPPGTFRVVEFVPTCDSACPNANVRARFSTPLDEASVTNNTVELYRCADATCGVGTITEVGTDLVYTAGGVDVMFPQSGGLGVPDVWYRAVVHGGASGVKAEDGRELGNLNFDSDGAGGTDSFSWTFQTASTTESCDLDSVTCQPANVVMPVGGTRPLQSYAFSAPNACNPAGEELDPWAFLPWQWVSSDTDRVEVNPPNPDPATVASGKQATLPGTPVDVTAATSGKNAICKVTVTTNTCVTDDDCINNPVAGACPGSQCVSGVCTPTIKSLSPLSAPVGSWVTVSGCYFDSYIDGQSQVLFLQNAASPDLPGLWPLPSTCGAPGSTWGDRQIIVEVPNKRDGDIDDIDDVVTAGPVRVVRGTDLALADSALPFTPIGGDPAPGICKLTPTSGQAGITQLRVEGENFGPPPPGAGDRIVFYNGTAAGAAVNGSDATWVSDNKVEDILVPPSSTNNPGSGPAPWGGNENELFLENNGIGSNLVDFPIVPPSCTVCTADPQCGGGATQGCGVEGAFHCCKNRPVVASHVPVNPPPTCRNAVIAVGFTDAVTGAPIVMDRTTINPTTVTLFNVTDSLSVPLSASDFRYPSSDSFSIIPPGLLLGGKQYRVTIEGDSNIVEDPAIPEGVLSMGHVGMNGDYTWQFQTNDSICQLARVQLDPATMDFVDIGASQGILAETYDQNGNLIAPVPGVYDWSWQWEPTSDPVATVTNSNDPSQTVTSAGNGTTTVRATAVSGAGWSGSKSGTAIVRVNACESTWPAVIPYNDPPGNAYHFSTWYCRDAGSLPVVNPAVGGPSGEDPNWGVCTLGSKPGEACRTDADCQTPSDPTGTCAKDALLRQFFFVNPDVTETTGKNDAVGLLIYTNEDHLSPSVWYKKKFNKVAPAATTTVDGYEAVRVGTSTYIAGTNLSGGELYTNIYVLGYNDDAGPPIVNIFSQMLANFRLNTNAASFGPDPATALPQVRRDTKRIADLKDYERALLAHDRTFGGFPALAAGSYLVGMSTSAWPSWEDPFGTALRSALPGETISHRDPLNTFTPACTDPFNDKTCWDERYEPNGRFFCPADSNVYAYQASDGGGQYDMFAHLEYLGPGTWQTGDINPCSAPSTCGCFNYQLTGTATGGVGSGDITPPTIPTALNAIAVGSDTISLSWGASSDPGGTGVQSYEIARSLDGVTFGSPIGFVAHPNVTWSNTGLAPSTTYFYRVVAKDFAGNRSGPSNVAMATTGAGAASLPPGNVSGLTATAGDGQVALSWTNPSDPGLVGIEIYRKDGSGSFLRGAPGTIQITPDATPSETSRTITGLTNGSAYTFGLFAYDGTPLYASGAFVEATPSGGASSSVPQVTNLSKAEGNNSVILSWNDPAPFTGFINIEVKRKDGAVASFPHSEPGVQTFIVARGVETYNDATAVNGQTYTYGVFVRKIIGSITTYSDGVFIQATPSGSAGVQNLLAFTAIPGDGQVLLTWINPPWPYAGARIRRSTTGYPPNPTSGSLVADVTSIITSYTDNGLTNGTTYYYTAFAFQGSPPVYASGVNAQATPNDAAPIITSVNIPAVEIGEITVRINWQTDIPSNSKVEYRREGTTTYQIASEGSYVTDHSIQIIAGYPNTLFYFRVSSQTPTGQQTTDVERVFVTDAPVGANLAWQGYYQSQPETLWNGCSGVCDHSMNQYYTCTDGEADCSDSRNASIGASTECGALAIADCLDSRDDLPHGGIGTLTQSILDDWQNGPVGSSFLPSLSQYQSACSAGSVHGMPYSFRIWSNALASSPSEVESLGHGSCGSGGSRHISVSTLLMILRSK